MVEWLRDGERQLITGSPICQSPAAVRGNVINRVPLEQFVCEGKKPFVIQGVCDSPRVKYSTVWKVAVS